jgi:hypothetical protein
MADKQYEKAMEAFEQVLPLVSGQTDKGERPMSLRTWLM